MRWVLGLLAFAGAAGASATAAADPIFANGDAFAGSSFESAGSRPRYLSSLGLVQAADDASYVRNWPAAVRLHAGRMSLDITPHAGFGYLSNGAQTAEAGAMIHVGQRPRERFLPPPDAGGEQSRAFFYAGSRRKAVGLGLSRSPTAPAGDLYAREGLVKETQAGFAYRRGMMQAQFGFSREKIVIRAMGEDIRHDNRIGFTFSIR